MDPSRKNGRLCHRHRNRADKLLVLPVNISHKICNSGISSNFRTLKCRHQALLSNRCGNFLHIKCSKGNLLCSQKLHKDNTFPQKLKLGHQMSSEWDLNSNTSHRQYPECIALPLCYTSQLCSTHFTQCFVYSPHCLWSR